MGLARALSPREATPIPLPPKGGSPPEVEYGLVVLADLSGVAKEALEVRVDNNVLSLRGQARHAVPGDVTYREYELVNFFRQFELHEKVEQQRITADLKCGVLTVHLPKAEEAKPEPPEPCTAPCRPAASPRHSPRVRVCC